MNTQILEFSFPYRPEFQGFSLRFPTHFPQKKEKKSRKSEQKPHFIASFWKFTTETSVDHVMIKPPLVNNYLKCGGFLVPLARSALE